MTPCSVGERSILSIHPLSILSILSIFHFINLCSCVPVIISNEFIWPFSPPFSSILDPSTFRFTPSYHLSFKYLHCSVNIPHSTILKDTDQLPHHLMKIGKKKYHTLQANVLQTASNFSYWSFPTYSPSQNPLMDGIIPDGGAIENLMKELTTRKIEGITKRWKECKKERKTVNVKNKRNDCKS